LVTPGIGQETKRIHGNNRQDRKRQKDAKIQMQAPEPVLALRPSAGVPAEVWHLPAVFPAVGAEW
jgi:hypothetical protein